MKAMQSRVRRLGGILAAILGASFLCGCASTPGEFQRLQVENELLREELRIVRSNCSYYREVEMELEEAPTPAAR
jgi:hypothetical protein